MKIVVDTNIVFSGILNTNSKIGDILLNSHKCFEFFSPDFLREEIERHKHKLITLSKLSSEQINEAFYFITNSITFISEEQIPSEIWMAAADLVKNIDINDIVFVALADYLDAVLWTGDKKLLKGLTTKGFDQHLSTEEIYKLRREIENN